MEEILLPPPVPDQQGKIKHGATTKWFPTSLKAHRDMFQSVADLLSWADSATPAFSHTAFYDKWSSGVEDIMDQTVATSEVEMTPKEKQSFDIVKDIAFNVFECFLGRAGAVGWSSEPAEKRKEHIDHIMTLSHVPQRTSEWYLQGKKVLTASEFATLYKSPRAISQLVMSKVLPTEPIDAVAKTNRLACMTCEMGPFDWGIRFEPIVKHVLSKVPAGEDNGGPHWGATIVESGRLLHPVDPLLAASPDGLIVDATDKRHVGRLLEIKCPITRTIGEGVPFEYWCQMQIQMEVTNIHECDYVEMKIDSIQKNETVLSGGAQPDGHIWLFQKMSEGCPMMYAYTEDEKRAAEESGAELIETIPWRVDKFYSVTVPRDRAWFESTKEMRARFWADVEKARAGTFTPVESSRPRAAAKQVVVVKKEGEDAPPSAPKVCLIVDDEPVVEVAAIVPSEEVCEG
jgi:hypothetical protein